MSQESAIAQKSKVIPIFLVLLEHLRNLSWQCHPIYRILDLVEVEATVMCSTNICRLYQFSHFLKLFWVYFHVIKNQGSGFNQLFQEAWKQYLFSFVYRTGLFYRFQGCFSKVWFILFTFRLTIEIKKNMKINCLLGQPWSQNMN